MDISIFPNFTILDLPHYSTSESEALKVVPYNNFIHAIPEQVSIGKKKGDRQVERTLLSRLSRLLINTFGVTMRR